MCYNKNIMAFPHLGQITHVPSALNAEEIDMLKTLGDQLFNNQHWDSLMVDGQRAQTLAHDKSGIQLVSLELDSVVNPKNADLVSSLAERYTNIGRYTCLGFNYFMGTNSLRITQPVHRDRRTAEVFTLSGEGGLSVFNEGDTHLGDIPCKPGDWMSAGSARHAGYGIASKQNPRVSAYFY